MTTSELASRIAETTKPDIERARHASQVFGQTALEEATCHTLVAAPIQGEARLFEITPSGGTELKTDGLPFVAIGSGQSNADPFVAFVRRLFWKTGQRPTMNQALFTIYWTLHHVCEIDPGGVAEPLQIAVLHKKDSVFVAEELRPEQLQEHFEAVVAAEKHLSNFAQHFQTDERDIQPIPSPDNDPAGAPPPE